MYITLEVLKLDTFKNLRELQWENICCILLILEVSKLFIYNETNYEQS